MYHHHKAAAFGGVLESLFAQVDGILEDRWGDEFAPHPNRPARGSTNSPDMDGLFEIAPDFTPGLGSEQGRGYLVSLRVATLDTVPLERYEALAAEAAALVAERLPLFFPGRNLRVVREGKTVCGSEAVRPCFKIVGDFSLGET